MSLEPTVNSWLRDIRVAVGTYLSTNQSCMDGFGESSGLSFCGNKDKEFSQLGLATNRLNVFWHPPTTKY